eukprot:CAMPEP_0174267954 /NCGR_PEP_ID=MMETSP0439-20130205/35551_1 /TAXON_ID=0 /ORGANISM="Stereomyxa ramosa, Strain Chinc5" /LENGTH=1811 /DNA_ID=CAMNT_0015355801 /DNA_START=40 /DNA_END=5472 /DNA_ORIENTATION=+
MEKSVAKYKSKKGKAVLPPSVPSMGSITERLAGAQEALERMGYMVLCVEIPENCGVSSLQLPATTTVESVIFKIVDRHPIKGRREEYGLLLTTPQQKSYWLRGDREIGSYDISIETKVQFKKKPPPISVSFEDGITRSALVDFSQTVLDLISAICANDAWMQLSETREEHLFDYGIYFIKRDENDFFSSPTSSSVGTTRRKTQPPPVDAHTNLAGQIDNTWLPLDSPLSNYSDALKPGEYTLKFMGKSHSIKIKLHSKANMSKTFKYYYSTTVSDAIKYLCTYLQADEDPSEFGLQETSKQRQKRMEQKTIVTQMTRTKTIDDLYEEGGFWLHPDEFFHQYNFPANAVLHFRLNPNNITKNRKNFVNISFECFDPFESQFHKELKEILGTNERKTFYFSLDTTVGDLIKTIFVFLKNISFEQPYYDKSDVVLSLGLDKELSGSVCLVDLVLSPSDLLYLQLKGHFGKDLKIHSLTNKENAETLLGTLQIPVRILPKKPITKFYGVNLDSTVGDLKLQIISEIVDQKDLNMPNHNTVEELMSDWGLFLNRCSSSSGNSLLMSDADPIISYFIKPGEFVQVQPLSTQSSNMSSVVSMSSPIDCVNITVPSFFEESGSVFRDIWGDEETTIVSVPFKPYETTVMALIEALKKQFPKLSGDDVCIFPEDGKDRPHQYGIYCDEKDDMGTVCLEDSLSLLSNYGIVAGDTLVVKCRDSAQVRVNVETVSPDFNLQIFIDKAVPSKRIKKKKKTQLISRGKGYEGTYLDFPYSASTLVAEAFLFSLKSINEMNKNSKKKKNRRSSRAIKEKVKEEAKALTRQAGVYDLQTSSCDSIHEQLESMHQGGEVGRSKSLNIKFPQKDKPTTRSKTSLPCPSSPPPSPPSSPSTSSIEMTEKQEKWFNSVWDFNSSQVNILDSLDSCNVQQILKYVESFDRFVLYAETEDSSFKDFFELCNSRTVLSYPLHELSVIKIGVVPIEIVVRYENGKLHSFQSRIHELTSNIMSECGSNRPTDITLIPSSRIGLWCPLTNFNDRRSKKIKNVKGRANKRLGSLRVANSTGLLARNASVQGTSSLRRNGPKNAEKKNTNDDNLFEVDLCDKGFWFDENQCLSMYLAKLNFKIGNKLYLEYKAFLEPVVLVIKEMKIKISHMIDYAKSLECVLHELFENKSSLFAHSTGNFQKDKFSKQTMSLFDKISTSYEVLSDGLTNIIIHSLETGSELDLSKSLTENGIKCSPTTLELYNKRKLERKKKRESYTTPSIKAQPLFLIGSTRGMSVAGCPEDLNLSTDFNDLHNHTDNHNNNSNTLNGSDNIDNIIPTVKIKKPKKPTSTTLNNVNTNDQHTELNDINNGNNDNQNHDNHDVITDNKTQIMEETTNEKVMNGGGNLSKNNETCKKWTVNQNIWLDPPDSADNIIYGTKKVKEVGGNQTVQKIVAATLNKLIVKMTPCNEYQDLKFMETFLLTYQSFTTPEIFLDKLIERYSPPEDLLNAKKKKDGDNVPTTAEIKTIQIRVCNVLNEWLDLEDLDDYLLKKAKDFIKDQVSVSHRQLELKLMNTIAKKERCSGKEPSLYASPLHDGRGSPAPPTKVPNNLYANNLNFFDVSDEEIARQITIIDHKLFSAIMPKELVSQAWLKPKLQKNAPNALKFIAGFNKVSHWVSYMIVKVETVRERVKMISKLLNIAKHLRDLNNFSSLMAFVAGWNSAAVSRLKRTNREIPKRNLELMMSIENTMSNQGNYNNYRTLITSVNPPCVPYLGVHLQDLVFIEEGNSDFCEGHLINFEKRELLAGVILELKNYKQRPYNLKQVSRLSKLLTDLPT